MKTNLLSPKNTPLYYIVGFLSILLTSCGSYQNSSYYDSDGIYGNAPRRAAETATQNNQYNQYDQNQYKEYFGSLQNSKEPYEVFTDVDTYSNYNQENDSLQNNDTSYPGWGSNPQGVSINVYDTGWAMNNWYGNNWGMNNGFGWGMNGGFGWGMNNWGMNNWGWNGGFGWGMNAGLGWNNWYGNSWGWNNWYGNGGGYSNYQSDRTYSYNAGRRGSTYTNSATSSRNPVNYTRTESTTRAQGSAINRSAINSRRGNTDFRTSPINTLNRTSPTFSRNQRQPQNNTYSTPTRREGNNSNSRQESYTPSRSYAPTSRSNTNSGSYTPSSNSSPRSSGNSGGGRSSGGGGRGGRG